MIESVTDLIVHHRADGAFSGDGNVRLWFADLDEQQAERAQLSWLSTSEHVRAARLKNPLHRRRYLASHVFRRLVLSHLTGIAPGGLELHVDKCSKPWLSLPEASDHLPSRRLLGFNVSHSENFLCIATAIGCDVGVDIEVVNPDLNVLAISQACLDQEDNEQARCSSPNKRVRVFYRLWTRREAFAKMLGHGVSSQHLHRTPTPPWSRRTLEFTLEKKQIVGSLAIGTPTGLFDTA